jgi:hypothetical protein
MFMLLTSVDAVAPGGVAQQDLVAVLVKARSNGIPVGIVSNHAEPKWFANSFADSKVQFLQVLGRQDGKIVAKNAEHLKLKSHDCLVLAASATDIQMGKNGKAVLIGAGWSNDIQAQKLGIRASSPSELSEVLDLITGWSGRWWFSANGPLYGVRAISDLSQYNKPISQQQFASKVTDTVKAGGPRLTALLAVGSRSLLVEGLGVSSDSLFGVYPSSSSANSDSEILSEFTHRVRTTVSRVRFARVGEPLFVRHKPSPKRHSGEGGDRRDPTSQLASLHLNPFYARRLAGRDVVVIDDCVTYGVSFGVSAALLRAAGAASVTGVALGKFGRTLHHFHIDITGNPFAPLSPSDWDLKSRAVMTGTEDTAAQGSLQSLIP